MQAVRTKNTKTRGNDSIRNGGMIQFWNSPIFWNVSNILYFQSENWGNDPTCPIPSSGVNTKSIGLMWGFRLKPAHVCPGNSGAPNCDFVEKKIHPGKLIWVFPKIGGTPKSSHLNRVFHYFHHPFWGFPPIFGNTPMEPQKWRFGKWFSFSIGVMFRFHVNFQRCFFRR